MWTIMPEEVIWEGFEEDKRQLLEVEWRGVKMLVEPTGFTQATVVRLLSTDPADYLRPELQPGSVLRYNSE